MTGEPLTKDKRVTSQTIAKAFEFESEVDLKEAARGTEYQLANYDDETGLWWRNSEVASAVRLLREKIENPELIAQWGKTQQERIAIGAYVKIVVKSKINEVFGEVEK